MKSYFHILGNTFISVLSTVVVWFAVIYWAYLQTSSVMTTAIMSGVYLLLVMLSGFWFGAIVDNYKKKHAMMLSSIATLVLFGMSTIVFITAPEGSFTSVTEPRLWIFVVLILFAVIASNIRSIALSTVTTIMVPEDKRDKMNGVVGTVNGLSFMVANIVAGFALSFAGLWWVLVVGVVVSGAVVIHLLFLGIPETGIIHNADAPKKLDIRGTIKIIAGIPGLFALIFFTTFNNFLSGVFMPLMDPYGLSLVPLHVWGTLWAVLGTGFLVGGIYISKKGLGLKPLRTLFMVNIVMWVICIVMVVQPSIILLSVCIFVWMCIMPFVEATEQTIVQKVVPLERQGRVFGFAQSIEQAASPVTAFLIGPIAQFIFIPFMTTGKGVELIGNWFGVGAGRGIALVFIATGVIGLIVTLVAMRSRSYKLLAQRYNS